MSFFEARLLDCISYGATGGPTWNTRKVGMRNGRVLRNANRSRPLYRYTAAYLNITEAENEDIVAAFNVCQGACHGFRWKDPLDYTVTFPDGDIGTTTGSPQTLQLTKTYTFSTGDIVRPIRKPVTGTVVIKVAGVVVVPTSIDYTTGLVTLTATAGGAIAWSGEFDVPVTFESDEFPTSIDNRNGSGFIVNNDFALIEDLTA